MNLNINHMFTKGFIDPYPELSHSVYTLQTHVSKSNLTLPSLLSPVLPNNLSLSDFQIKIFVYLNKSANIQTSKEVLTKVFGSLHATCLIYFILLS